MLLENFLFLLLIPSALIFLSEWKNRKVDGIIGSIILFLIGLVVLSDGLEYGCGQTITITNNGSVFNTNTGALSGTVFGNKTINETSTDGLNITSNETYNSLLAKTYSENWNGTIAERGFQNITNTYCNFELPITPATGFSSDAVFGVLFILIAIAMLSRFLIGSM